MLSFPQPQVRRSLRSRALVAVLARRARAQEGEPYDVPAAREQFERFAARGAGRGRAPWVEEEVAGVRVARSSSGAGSRGTVLAFHGGAYVVGVPTAVAMAGHVVRDGGPDVVSVDYRMAPEHPWPAGRDDALAVYEALLGSVGADRLVLAGESAGGGMALTLLQSALAAGLPAPAGVVLVNPWTDLSLGGASVTANRGRDILVHSQLAEAARWYAGELALTDPAVSPLFGSFTGFPPTYVAVGTRDLLLDDSVRLGQRLRADGVDAHVDVFEGACHGFNAVSWGAGALANERVRAVVDTVLPARGPGGRR